MYPAPPLLSATDCEPPPLIVVEQNPLVAVRFLEHLVLGSQVIDHLLLLAIDPACDNDQSVADRVPVRQ